MDALARVFIITRRDEIAGGPGKLVPLGVGIDEVEELEITLRVADDAVEIVDLKQAQVAVIILNAFLLKFGALVPPSARRFRCVLPRGGTQFDDRSEAIRNHAVAGHRAGRSTPFAERRDRCGAAIFPGIQSEDLAHFDRAVLVRPILRMVFKSKLIALTDDRTFTLQLSIVANGGKGRLGARRLGDRSRARSWEIAAEFLISNF